MRRTLPLLAVVLLACALAAVAGAAFGVSTPGSATSSGVTLNGVDKTSTFTTTITASGGTSTGWNISAWAPIPISGTKTLGALEVTAKPTLTACSGGGCSQPTLSGTITWPVTLGTTSPSAVKIYNAKANTGLGTNFLTVIFGVTVPASALPGSYSTTLTVIGSGAGP